jgi:hypothetical protein
VEVTIQVPDYVLEPVKDRLATEPTGILKTIALEAILGYLDLLLDSANVAMETHSRRNNG